MASKKTLSRRGHDILDSNIHVTNKTIFRPGISTRGTDRAIKSIAPKCDPALEKELVEVYFAGSVAPELVIE
ncbi:hypothetical protein BDR04DRAFT_1111000 [Suillus decipiens]|nr:hypothetical protein BDR04DRAFT_1111000 [Suillus decipiens]